jgi:CMD domain protein
MTTSDSAIHTSEDVINRLAGISADSRLGQLRAQRPEIVRYAEGSYRALLEPADLAGVSRIERELIALRVATLTASHSLADWHRQRLHELGAHVATITATQQNPTSADLSVRKQALLRHVDRVSQNPAASTAAQLAELSAAGFSPRDVVIVGQLTAFLSFQVRTLIGLRLLAEDV